MTPLGFICVGGPLDGQWKAWDAPRFYVAELDKDYGDATINALVGVAVRQRCYVLSEHEEHGTAWVCQP